MSSPLCTSKVLCPCFLRVISSNSLWTSWGADIAWRLYAVFFFSVSSLQEKLLNWLISVRRRGKSSETVNISEKSQFSEMLPHRNKCVDMSVYACIHRLSVTTNTGNWDKNWDFSINRPKTLILISIQLWIFLCFQVLPTRPCCDLSAPCLYVNWEDFSEDVPRLHPHWMMLHPRDRGSTNMRSFECPSHWVWVIKLLNLCVYNSMVFPLVCEMSKQ